MSRSPIARKTIRDELWPGVLAGAVLGLIALLDVFIWPQYRDGLKDFQLPDAFKGLLGEAGSIATPEGFLAAEFFSWVGLVLITIAIIAGTAAVAGEEGSGTLDLLLSLPIRRSRLLLQKSLAIALLLGVAALMGWVGFVLARLAGEMPLGNLRFLEAIVSMLPLIYLFLALSVTAGALFPSRGSAAAICVGLVVVAYFANAVGGAVSSLEWLQKSSPFYWADGGHVLIKGFDWLRSGLMLLLAGAVLAFGVACFERRDIGSGQWALPWRRAASLASDR